MHLSKLLQEYEQLVNSSFSYKIFRHILILLKDHGLNIISNYWIDTKWKIVVEYNGQTFQIMSMRWRTLFHIYNMHTDIDGFISLGNHKKVTIIDVFKIFNIKINDLQIEKYLYELI